MDMLFKMRDLNLGYEQIKRHVEDNLKNIHLKLRKIEDKQQRSIVISQLASSDNYRNYLSLKNASNFKDLLISSSIYHTHKTDYSRKYENLNRKSRDFYAFADAISLNEKFNSILGDVIPVVEEGIQHQTQADPRMVAATTVIDQDFKSAIKNHHSFTPTDYFLAKRRNCQWYGVFEGWDVGRKGYSDLLRVCKEAFNIDRCVAAIVYGDGGAGKSTVLRRLANDLIDQPFKILWADEKSLETLANKTVNDIGKTSKVKYLLIIDDWFRQVNNSDESLVLSFLDSICRLKNVRLVIGDRNYRGKPYIKLNPGVYKILIDNTQNLEILEHVKKISAHQTNSDEELPIHEELIRRLPIFLLLFILMAFKVNPERYDNKLKGKPVDLFLSILIDDLNFLNSFYPGLVRMICYAAIIYKEHSYFFTDSSFLKLANHFDPNDSIFKHFANFEDGVGREFEILRKYLSTIDRHQVYGELPSESQYIKFNHDVLVEWGLWKLSDYIGDIPEFDDNIRKSLIQEIVDIAPEAYSTSFLLNLMMKDRLNLYSNHDDWMELIKPVVQAGNSNKAFLNEHVNRLELSPDSEHLLMDLLLKNNIAISGLWHAYIKKYPSKANEILKPENIDRLHGEIICNTINALEYGELQQNACHYVLNQPKFYLHHPAKVITSLNCITDLEIKLTKCKEILNVPENISIHKNILKRAREIIASHKKPPPIR